LPVTTGRWINATVVSLNATDDNWLFSMAKLQQEAEQDTQQCEQLSGHDGSIAVASETVSVLTCDQHSEQGNMGCTSTKSDRVKSSFLTKMILPERSGDAARGRSDLLRIRARLQ